MAGRSTVTSSSNTAGIAIIAFVIAVAFSIAYYQFVYIPQANSRPVLPQAVLKPQQTVQVSIASGASNQGNGRFFVPSEVRAALGTSNLVVWTSGDAVPHTVTSDNSFKDRYSRAFDSRERPQEEGGPFVMPGKTYQFLFTEIGDYPYHCEPHPWMKGIVHVVESFA
jgi:plastocyanin